MKAYSITKPRKIVEINHIFNDLDHVFGDLSECACLKSRLKKLRQAHRHDHTFADKFFQACREFFIHLEDGILSKKLNQLSDCIKGSVEGLGFENGEFFIEKRTLKSHSLINGLSREACLLYLWKEAEELYKKKKDSHQLLAKVKYIVSRGWSFLGELREAELEWKFIHAAKTYEEILEIKAISLVNCDEKLFNQYQTYYIDLVNAWKKKILIDSKQIKQRTYFLRSILEQYSNSLSVFKKSGVFELLLRWSKIEFDKSVENENPNLQMTFSALRNFLWMDSLLSQERDFDPMKIKTYAKKCFDLLKKTNQHWLNIYHQPSYERGINSDLKGKLKHVIHQLESILNISKMKKGRMLSTYLNSGDAFIIKCSKYLVAFKQELRKLIETLNGLYADAHPANFLEKDVNAIWKKILDTENTIQEAFVSMLQHPKIKFQSHHRNLFVKWFVNKQSLLLAV